jgi:hypothetical protein
MSKFSSYHTEKTGSLFLKLTINSVRQITDVSYESHTKDFKALHDKTLGFANCTAGGKCQSHRKKQLDATV